MGLTLIRLDNLLGQVGRRSCRILFGAILAPLAWATPSVIRISGVAYSPDGLVRGSLASLSCRRTRPLRPQSSLRSRAPAGGGHYVLYPPPTPAPLSCTV